MIKQNDKVTMKIIPFVWLYAIIVTLIMYLVTSDTIWAWSFILGVATNLLSFSMLSKANRKLPFIGEKKAFGYMFANQITRYLIYGMVLYVASLKDSLEIVPAFIGMLSIKIVLTIYILFKGDEGA